jgi:hypothetical protein
MSQQPADFSPKAIGRAVLQQSLSKPHVLYPTAVGILGGVAALVLGPSLVFVVPAALGVLIGGGAWAFDYGIRRDKATGEYFRRMHEQLQARMRERIQGLREDLEAQGRRDGVSQLARLAKGFGTCEEVLRRKLKPTELTFNRYLGMTEQVFLAGLDNLRQIADASRSIGGIDATATRTRIEQLEGAASRSSAQEQELQALQERQALLQRQYAKIETWLAENEQALTQLDRVIAAISDMDTAQDHAQMDMEPAMQELKTLIERAQDFARPDAAAAAAEAIQGGQGSRKGR